MALKIRLARGGAKKRPFYRIVVAEATAPRDGRFVEKVGTYNPLLPREHAERLVLRADRIQYWISQGAQPTERVAKFLGETQLAAAPVLNERPKQSAPKAKAQERLREKAAKELAAQEAAEKAKADAEAAKAEAEAAANAPAEEPAVAVDAPADAE